MSDEAEQGGPNQSFADLVSNSEAFSARDIPPKRIVEFVGRVYRAGEGAFTMALLPDSDGLQRVIEANVADVVHHEVVFEDSSGRKTLKVRLPEDAPIKLILQAAHLSGGPNAPAVAKQDVKPDPIKQHDPIKQQDPVKHDPVKQQDPIKPDPIKQHDPIKQ